MERETEATCLAQTPSAHEGVSLWVEKQVRDRYSQCPVFRKMFDFFMIFKKKKIAGNTPVLYILYHHCNMNTTILDVLCLSMWCTRDRLELGWASSVFMITSAREVRRGGLGLERLRESPEEGLVWSLFANESSNASQKSPTVVSLLHNQPRLLISFDLLR